MSTKKATSSEKTSRIHIFTGPPGAGKLVHVANSPYLRNLPIFCCYVKNKKHWEDSNAPEIILFAYSAQKQAKQYWLEQSLAAGRTPRLYLVDTPKNEAIPRMLSRPRNNRLLKEINHWYEHYTPHPDEEIIYVRYNSTVNREVYE